jgi:hypothetical protein
MACVASICTFISAIRRESFSAEDLQLVVFKNMNNVATTTEISHLSFKIIPINIC